MSFHSIRMLVLRSNAHFLKRLFTRSTTQLSVQTTASRPGPQPIHRQQTPDKRRTGTSTTKPCIDLPFSPGRNGEPSTAGGTTCIMSMLSHHLGPEQNMGATREAYRLVSRALQINIAASLKASRTSALTVTFTTRMSAEFKLIHKKKTERSTSPDSVPKPKGFTAQRKTSPSNNNKVRNPHKDLFKHARTTGCLVQESLPT